MKAIVLVVALAMTACAPRAGSGLNPPTAPVPSAASSAADRVILSSERAFGAAEVVYIAMACRLEKAAKAGLIRGPAATRLLSLNATARRILIVGKATGDTAERARAAIELFDVIDQLEQIKGR